MDTQSLAAELEPLDVPAERLYRMPPEVYRGMIDHGLLTEGEGVVLRDGLLLNTPSEGAADLTDRLYRMPLDVYDRVAEIGLLGPSDKVVLLDGLLVNKMTKGPPHIAATKLVVKALDGVVPVGWHVAKEDPVVLPTGPARRDSEPEPDVSVVRGGVRDYLTRKPGPADTALVVEVAEGSLREDRAKLIRFAWPGVPVAWLVNLNERVVEVHTRPSGPTDPAGYEEMTAYGEGGEVPVVVDGREVGRLAVNDLLP